MERRPRHFSKDRDGQQAHEKMLNVANYRDANQNYTEISHHGSQKGHDQKV